MFEPSPRALRIAILGAECTGKTALAQALRERLALHTGLRVAGVAEWLRDWCEREGRTPAVHEQQAIAQEQQRRIDKAAASHDIVVCDTTPLMTSIYSQWYFGDASLDAYAAEEHARSDVTLLMAIDLAWQADGMQRSGAPVREPIDTLLRERLLHHRLPFSVVSGQAQRRLEHAMAALQSVLAAHAAQRSPVPATGSASRGLFTSRLAGRQGPGPVPGGQESKPEPPLADPPAAVQATARFNWVCECCVPDAEAASLRQRIN